MAVKYLQYAARVIYMIIDTGSVNDQQNLFAIYLRYVLSIPLCNFIDFNLFVDVIHLHN